MPLQPPSPLQPRRPLEPGRQLQTRRPLQTLPPFQTLLDAHGRDVHHLLIALVGRLDADDCYQETWLAALRSYPNLRDASNLRGWVLTIAHRKAIDHVRSGARRALPLAELPAVEAEGPASVDPLGNPGLWDEVRRLAPKQRSAIALRFLADCTYTEMAALMGTSEEAARRNVHEGLKRLRREHRP